MGLREIRKNRNLTQRELAQRSRVNFRSLQDYEQDRMPLEKAAAITVLDSFLQKTLTGNLAVLTDMLYALVLILLVIYNNAPALKNFREKWNIKTLLSKLKKHDPSKVSDDEAKWDRVPTKIMVDEVLSVDIQVQSPYTPDKRQKEDK